jgi:predicted metalloprotease
MRWRTGRRSSNVEDRRGARMPIPMGRGGAIGGGGLLLIIVIALLFGVDPTMLLEGMAPQQSQVPQRQGPVVQSAAEQELTEFVSVVLADTEDTWNALLSSAGRRYAEPRLVLFTGGVRSACGFASSAAGPFYCPGDQKVYLDLEFFAELQRRFGAPGDFAQAYVIAHEVGHHVQTLLGISRQVREAQSRAGKAEANSIQVRMELQADCLAGVWANHAHRARNILEQGDIEEALGAASAIGDDTLQKQAQGYVVPDAFTHGTSEQRMRWFKIGLQEGEFNACDTFAQARL